MLTSCSNELPNPHKNCVGKILNVLIIYDNDIRRINLELRKLNKDFQDEMDKINFRCSEIRKPKCENIEVDSFTQHINTIDSVKTCFEGKIETLKKNRMEILTSAKRCLFELNVEKCKFKQFHEKTIDYLRRHAIKATDPEVVRKCDIDICEMNMMFCREVAMIKKCENEIQPLCQQLHESDFQYFCNCCCFKDYDWIPMGRNIEAVNEIANVIKSSMGTTIKRALAQAHVQKAPDIKQFMAEYLINLQRNEEKMKEKTLIFGNE